MGLRYGTPLLRWRQSSSMVSGILTFWSPWSIKDLPKSWRSLGVSLSRLSSLGSKEWTRGPECGDKQPWHLWAGYLAFLPQGFTGRVLVDDPVAPSARERGRSSEGAP